ncbi:hypothetical protein ACHQM5_021694 [Ranunculus cassubicifolius]
MGEAILAVTIHLGRCVTLLIMFSWGPDYEIGCWCSFEDKCVCGRACGIQSSGETEGPFCCSVVTRTTQLIASAFCSFV